jgi:gliding motility-associated-like protein
MKKFLLQSIFILLLVVVSTSLSAQSEAFAGGDISVEYVGPKDLPCNSLNQRRYRITFKFYRDCPSASNPLPDEKRIYLRARDREQATGTPQIFQLDLTNFDDKGEVEDLCTRNDICTVGRWYWAETTLPFYDSRWQIFYGTLNNNGAIIGVNYNSPENFNIDAGQTFYVETFYNNTCREITTDADGDPANVLIRNTGESSTPEWVFEDPVVTFCAGRTYNYRLALVDEDRPVVDLNLNNPGVKTAQIADSISYEMVSARTRSGGGVSYVPGFTPSAPVPSSTPIRFDKKTGVLSFTPYLGPNELSFTGVAAFLIKEWRREYTVRNVFCGNEPNCPPSNFRQQIFDTLVLKSSALRQMRFVIDKRCKDSVPSFTSTKFNNTENAWEFDCASESLDFTSSLPLFANSLDRLDFRIFRGGANSTQDDDAYAIDSIIVLDENKAGLFTKFRVYLHEELGPGNYTMFGKNGKDGNFLITGCVNEIFLDRDGIPSPDSIVAIPLYVNTKYQYIYGGPNPLIMCYPNGIPFEINAAAGQRSKVRDNIFMSTFAYRGPFFGQPEQFKDTLNRNKEGTIYEIADTTYTVPPDYPNTQISDFQEGYWTVGIGLDYPYTYNGVQYNPVCYDDDPNVRVEFYQNEIVEIPFYDICPDEDWPLVNLDTLSAPPYSATDYNWYYYNKLPPSLGGGVDTIRVGGASNDALRNDSLWLGEVGAGIGPKVFTIGVEFLLAGVCPTLKEFNFVRQEVDVEIGRDSTICPGEQYLLKNQKSDTYVLPENMTFQWYIDDVPVPGANTEELMITKRGMYKLVAIKEGETKNCEAADSVFINVADSLFPPEPVCTQVTFANGDVEQLFFIPGRDGTDFYQVRTVDDKGNPVLPSIDWEPANDQWGLNHRTLGRGKRLEVRGVNIEVDETAPCKYGPTSIAEACDIIVKPVNVFTPNGDGVNDFLRFDLLEVLGGKLQVFNRWGEKIFESADYQNDWDGGDYKAGTYFYILEIFDGPQDLLKGNFTIIR